MNDWIDKQSEAHLEATEWFSFCQEGFPDAVIFANDGSVLDGTYKQVRYIQDQRYQQLEQVARELYKDLERVSDKRLERSKRENMLETHFNKLYDLGVEL